MKKSNFVAMILGTIGGIFTALGMCMVMLPEWNAFKPGVLMGGIGLVVLLITLLVWRRMENKTPIHFTGKTILAVIIGIAGALILGIGMTFTMVWGNIILGIILGLVGILMLLMLIPLIKGIK